MEHTLNSCCKLAPSVLLFGCSEQEYSFSANEFFLSNADPQVPRFLSYTSCGRWCFLTSSSTVYLSRCQPSSDFNLISILMAPISVSFTFVYFHHGRKYFYKSLKPTLQTTKLKLFLQNILLLWLLLMCFCYESILNLKL